MGTNHHLAFIATVTGILGLGWLLHGWLEDRGGAVGVAGGVKGRVVWFYDLGTDQLFSADADAVPPIQAPSGIEVDGRPGGVRAKVFACGGCADPADRFIGWLEQFTPEAQRAMIQNQTNPIETHRATPIAYMDQLLVRAVQGDRWHRASSEEAAGLLGSPRQRCPDGVVLHACFPD